MRRSLSVVIAGPLALSRHGPKFRLIAFEKLWGQPTKLAIASFLATRVSLPVESLMAKNTSELLRKIIYLFTTS